jgi:pentatricopeptide repeat protein
MERLAGRFTGVIRRLIVHASVRRNATLSSSSRLASAPTVSGSSAERKRVDAAMARAMQSIQRAGKISDQDCESLNDIFIECTRDSELDARCSTEALASLLQHLLSLSARSHSSRRSAILDLSEAVRFMMKRHLVERNSEAAVRLWHQISCGDYGERFVSDSELLTLAVQALNVHGLAAESELLFRVSRAMLTGNPLEAEAALRSGLPDAVTHVRKAYQSHNIPAATAETFNTVMNGYLQASRMEEAQKILSDMASLSLPVSEKTFEPFISWHCANKNLSSALSLLNQVLIDFLAVAGRA